jgi:hypothetical protein
MGDKGGSSGLAVKESRAANFLRVYYPRWLQWDESTVVGLEDEPLV